MVLSIIQIGNSRGIRLPKSILEQCHIKNHVEVEVQDEKITIRPLKKPREGWAEQMKLMHERGEDKLLIPDVFDDDSTEDWEWK